MNMESLTISCSPETYRRVENDKEYRLELTHSVLSEQGTSFSQVIFTQEAPLETEEVEQETSDNSVPINTKGNDDIKLYWHDAPIKLMLTLMEDLRPKLGKSVHVKTKAKLYEIICQKMAGEGYNFSAVQIENKFRGLEKSYKKTVLNNRQTGRNRQTCAYESELHRILGQKKGIHPEFVLESGDSEGISYSPAFVDSDDKSNSSQDEVESPVPKIKAKGVRQQIMEKMILEKKEFHSKVLNLLEKRDERAQKREERAQKREERSQRKLELLEMLVKKIEK